MAAPRSDDSAGSVAPQMPDDWPAQAADRIEALVGTVRDKTTGPAITAARWAVYGLLAAVVGTASLVLLLVLLVRVIDVYLPASVFGEQHVWVVHLILGVPMLLAGIALLVKANRPSVEDGD